MYYSKPGDLLSLGSTPAEAEEVRRLLSKLTAADLDAAQRDRDGIDIDAVHRSPRYRHPDDVACAGLLAWHNAMPGCTGPCDQGRKLCTTPEACLRVAADDDALSTARGAIIGAACGIAIWAAAAALWGML